MNKILKNKKAFTLIELIVVMAVIAILVMLAAPRFIGYTKDANVSGLKTDTKMLSNIAIIYNVENDGKWPTSGEKIEDTAHAELRGAVTGDLELYAIDNVKIKDQYKSLKNELNKYVIDTATGDVYHIEGVEDRAKNTWFNETAVIKATP